MNILNQDTSDVEQTKEVNPTGQVQEEGVAVISDSGTAKTETAETDPKQKTMVLDGPLSTIYTKALNVVYANTMQEKIGTETQQMDSVLVADAHRFIEKRKELSEIEEIGASYVYVTDEAGIEEEGLSKTYDDLRIALDMQGFSKKAVCIEVNRTKIPNKQVSLISEFVSAQGVPVFFSRESMMSYLKG